jgi:uncharacterized peroxidase-related enzyme
MPFINYVEPEDAPAEVRRIYEAGEKQRGLLMTTWKLVAHSPKTYRAYGQFLGAVSNPEVLPKSTLELAILKTSLLNSCIYCTTHHYHAGLAAGNSLEQMLALNDFETYDGFSEAEKAAVAFAEEITLNPSRLSLEDEEQAVSKATRDRLKKQFSDQAIAELVMGVSVFNFMARYCRFLGPDVDMELPPQALQDMMGPSK